MASTSVEEALPELERLETVGQELAGRKNGYQPGKGLEEYLLELSRSQQSVGAARRSGKGEYGRTENHLVGGVS